ncbi:FAD-binding oxidoreductase [Salmonella enterica subsp. enterica]|nr:FAD-binding oxidoreductase [Salmonella enterica]EBQ9479960.1 FAD-binding oxidoreductase [Salmonella enterica subsp. enterica serovar Kokomlemle]ECS5198533.1 FAD-binding oxidoreductase [Salmonella enterica subsp. enterica serovar Poano]EBJ7122025.1 FAD-binding oxidoreductase [Salmonella enterica]ECX4750928.1 FAD-binding oxidoreductase [Salmonella enterica]
MTNRWDVIVIGAGLAGSALAANLSQTGTRTLLLEAAAPGCGGASARSRGIVRVYDPNPTLMRCNVGGVREWRRLNQRWPGLFTECGIVYLLRGEHIAAAQPLIREFSGPDYPITLISRQQAMVLIPGLNIPPEAGILYEEKGGYVNPSLACLLLANQAREQGAELLEGISVTRLESQYDGVIVHTANQAFHARLAVVATGAHSPGLVPESTLFSRSIPLSNLYCSTAQAPGRCLIDEYSGSYMRPGSPVFVFAGGAPQQDAVAPEALPQTAGWHPANLALAQKMLPDTSFQHTHGWDGYDGYTADFLPETRLLAGRHLALFCGFSGRGAKYIPDAARQFSLQLRAYLQ